MQNWRTEYITGIKDAEKQHPVNRELIAAYSQLCDRLSTLEAEKALLQSQLQQQQQQQQQPPPSSSRKTTTTTPPPTSPPSSDDTNATITRLRLDLTEALRSKSQFQSRLAKSDDELARLRTKTTSDSKALADLTAQARTLSRKLRDREEELRAKNKLVADVQDELAVLNMQLDQVEKQRAKREAEYNHLLSRYMVRVEQETEAMNLEHDKSSSSSTKQKR
ncbi:autophagy protein 16, interacts with Atg12p-Atg5p [Podospora pseudopauciseta]|uniref:Autophagy protein 16, interacts with Atg12p-Atg5p n=1 Tax=Podospora pseudopauciseta TaxID=2093780 RepID=A0ABR0H0V1_9PEZI|nr:autophagy protein 16, interacts with Atg12p-Atg5p [Podospora pseudopauciseta]